MNILNLNNELTKSSEYPIELQSNLIITVIRDPNGPMGKVFSFDENNNVTKKASPSRGEYTAIMYRVETHEDLSNLLKTISEDPNMAIINASFNGIEINETFTILSESKLAKRLNLPEERNQLTGVHTIETNEGSVKLVGRFAENMRPSDWQFFDRDINSHTPDAFADLSLVDWLKQLGELLPETKNVSYAIEPSSSSRVLIDGVPYGKNNGHLWMKFSRLGDMSNLRKALKDRAEKTNMYWKGPNNRQDTIIDPSVFSVGRIVFTGAPTVADDMEIKLFMMDIVHGSSDSLNASTILPNGEKPELRLSMYLRTENEGQVTIAELLKLIRSGDKIKCEAPFRDSSSMAAFISLNPEGKPFIFDSGSSETYWLNDQEWSNFSKDRTLDIVQAMINRSATDCGAPYEIEASKALNVLARDNPDEYQRTLYALKQNRIALVDLKAHLKKQENSNEDSKDSDGALAAKLTQDILSTPRCELLFDANKDSYVRMMVDGVLQTLSVESQGFHDWLAYYAFNKYNSPLRDDVAKQVKQLISANCRFGQKEESKIFMRVGECAGTYYLDLGRPDWSCSGQVF